MLLRFTILSLLFLLNNVLFAQNTDDSLTVRLHDDANTSILALDTSSLLLEEDIKTGDGNFEIQGNRSVNLVSVQTKDSTSVIRNSIEALQSVKSKYDTIPLSIGARAVILDSLYWMGVDSVFQIFDSMRVDPYGFDGSKFRDTLFIKLFDSIPDTNGITRAWSMPLQRKHYITSNFGNRGYKWHFGADLRLAIGDSVTAVFDGVVRVAKYNYGGYGNYVIVRHHNGLETLYGHLSKRLVHVGDLISAGQLVGWGGNTGRSSGPHLHFEVRFRGDALDPNIIFGFLNDTIRYQTFELTPHHFEYLREMRRRIYHRVRSGDTLFGIAGRYHVSWRQIARLNRITTKTTLRIGQRLRIR